MTLTQSHSNSRTRRVRLLERLAEARDNTDAIFRISRPEVLYDRPIPERLRIVLYLRQLEAFHWRLLSGAALRSWPFHPPFYNRFAFGIHPRERCVPND